MKHFALPALLLLMSTAGWARQHMPLDGVWQFGYGDTVRYDDTIILPGSMLTNGKGNDVGVDTKWTGSLYDMSYYHADMYEPYRQPGNIKFPFFLTPDKEYVGKAYYRRTINIPSDWKGQKILLTLERPHIETIVKVNGKTVGHDMSLSTPHVFDLTAYVTPGDSDTLDIEIYNGIENVCVGQDSHSVTDQTQGNWNGIVGDIALSAVPAGQSIGRVRIYPDAANRTATVKVLVDGGLSGKTKSSVTASPRNFKGRTVKATKPSAIVGDTLLFKLDMGKVAACGANTTPTSTTLPSQSATTR